MTLTQDKDSTIRLGMIVRLCRRIWRVENIADGILTAAPIDDFGSRAQQFLLELESPEPGNLAEPSLEHLGDYTLQSLFLQAVCLNTIGEGYRGAGTPVIRAPCPRLSAQ